MQLDTVDTKKNIALPKEMQEAEVKKHVIKEVIDHYLQTLRAGTSKQKTRSEVRGGGIKPWRQKGTGRARAGSIRSPLMRTGGVVFANRGDRNFAGKINKKLFTSAIKNALLQKIKDKKFFVIEDFAISKPNTKSFIARLAELDIPFFGTLLLVNESQDAVILSARNCKNLYISHPNQLHPYMLTKCQRVVCSLEAYSSLTINS